MNHKDENPQNNVVWINEDGSIDYEKSNLEWCTNKYNANYGVRSKKISVALSKTVFQYDLNNNLIKEWLSAREIKRVLGFSQQTICDCCNGKINNYKGFVWKYKR